MNQRAEQTPCVAVLDFGTGGGKCLILDLAGNRLARIRLSWSFASAPSPYEDLTPGFAFDPDEMWTTLARCTREAIAEAQIRPEDVVAVTTTSLRLGTVFLGHDKREVYCGPNLDGRGFAGALELLESVSREKIISTTGHWPPFLSSAARLIAYQQDPEARKVAHVLNLNDWLGYRLTGEIFSEVSNAAESFLLDINSRQWSPELCGAAAIEAAVLPEILPNGQRLGEIRDSVAAETNLAPGTPVFMGGADTQCALLGSGITEAAEVGVVLGTTAPVMAVTDTPLVHPTGRIWTGCHVEKNRWTLESNAGETGSSWDWLLSLTGLTDPDRYERAEELMLAFSGYEEAQKSVVSFAHPQVFDLENYNPQRMIGLGFRQSDFRGSVGPERGQVLRALLRNIAFAIRGNLEQLHESLPKPPSRCTLSGGMSRSLALQAEIARTLDVPVQITNEPEATAMGAAILAAAGGGWHADTTTAIQKMVRLTKVAPQTEFRADYDRHYADWQRIFETSKQVSFQS